MSEIKVPINRKTGKPIINESDFRIPSDLPDITFLRRLSIQGRLRYNQGTGTTPISIVPTIGQTQFFYSLLFDSSAIGNNTFTVRNDGMTRILNIIDTNIQQISFFDSLVGDGKRVSFS